MPPPPQFPQNNITPDINTKIQTILHVALIAAKYKAKRFANIVPVLLQRNNLPNVVIPREIFEDEDLYIPEYHSQTNTNTEARPATTTQPQPSTSRAHLLPQPQPQRQPRLSLQQNTTKNTNEHKRKLPSPLNTHKKKDKKDPLPPMTTAPPHRHHDDTILGDSDSGDSLQINLPEVEAGATSLPAPLGDINPILPVRRTSGDKEVSGIGPPIPENSTSPSPRSPSLTSRGMRLGLVRAPASGSSKRHEKWVSVSLTYSKWRADT